MFQAAVGVFLHCCNTPESVIDFLARIGVSVSAKTITRSVKSLSKQAESAIRNTARKVLSAYAYDNLDVDMKPLLETVETAKTSLVHLTTATLLPLHHVEQRDLDCSEMLWKMHTRNPHRQPSDVPHINQRKLNNIHPEVPHSSGLTRRQRYNAWKFRYDLVHFGPEEFQQYQQKIGDPEVIDAIPLTKGIQIPFRTVDVSPSTPKGNDEALRSFFKQASIGDPNENTEHELKSPGNLAILVFGDLLTGQHLSSLQDSLAHEKTLWRRLQFLCFVMGLFHLKMACADAIWRIFIHPRRSQEDSTSLMSCVQQIRPKETGKIKSKPGFRRMHEVIQHVGLVSRLDMWRLAAQKIDSRYTSLEDFAKSKPTWEKIVEMSEEIQREWEKVGTITKQREQPRADRDKQRENSIMQHQYFLLYEEISHAMNYGDIGRVETCFLPWIYIFMGCGKFKYAKEMRRYLENVHFRYPKKLRCVSNKSAFFSD